MSGICQCNCHTSGYAPCDIPGGCGCGRTRTCTVCPVVRPDAEPRIPNRPPVCDGDRNLLDRHLIEIGHLHADLVNPEPPIVDQRRHERFGIEYLKGGGRRTVSLGEVWSDPLAAVNGVSPIPSKSKQPAVGGSRERPLPIPVDRLDLKAPARLPNPTAAGRDWPDDQIGRLSTATVLDLWTRDIRDVLFAGQHLPAATVDELITWLRNRLDDICDRHPDVAQFAIEVRDLRAALRHATGTTEPQPQLCEGVACPRCDLRTLYQMPGDTYRAQCGNCGTLLNDEEYSETAKAQETHERSTRTPEEIIQLLRQPIRRSACI